VKRFFAYYSKEEIEKEIERWFELIDFSRTEMPQENYLNFLGRKKGY